MEFRFCRPPQKNIFEHVTGRVRNWRIVWNVYSTGSVQLMTSNLSREAFVYNLLKEKLLQEHEALRDDHQALEDTLEGISNFNEAVEYFVDAIAEDEAMLLGLSKRKENIETRIKRHKAAIEAKKIVLRDALQAVGKRNIKHPEFTVYLGTVKARMDIESEEELPDDYITIMQVETKHVNKEKLEQDVLVDNKTVPGVVIIPEHETIRIRKA